MIADSTNDDLITQKFCSKCGEFLINKCEACNQNIKGRPRCVSHIDPSFAYFPGLFQVIILYQLWPLDKSKKEAAFEMIQFSEALNPTEKEDLRNSINDLVTNSPKANVAIVKFKTYAAKAGTRSPKD